MTQAAPNSKSPGLELLIVYGVPPAMELKDSSNRRLGTFELTQRNQGSFEAALRSALGVFVGHHGTVATARMVFVRNAQEFRMIVRNTNPTHLIYYGHALSESNTLLPSLGKSITAWQLSQTLKGTSVKDFDILGCSSSSIAAELSTTNPELRIGYLRFRRQDNIEANPSTMQVLRMNIDRQVLHHFDPKPK